jgi:hypothetical protein
VRGQVAGRTLDETIAKLETTFPSAAPELEMRLAEGEPLLDAASALERWSTLPPEASRWPAVGTNAPDFSAVDLAGATHALRDAGARSTVLAFWNAEDDLSVARAARVETAWRERGDAAARFVHVAALGERDPVARAAAAHSLAQPVWLAGGGEASAFARFRIWTAPVFVRLEGLEVKAITKDPDEARRWFEKR